MRKTLTSALAICLVAGCGGREAMPVTSYKYGDEKLSCEELRYEMSKVEREVRTLYGEDHSAGNDNVALGVAGAILFWPALFALDTGNAEKVEIRAYRERYDVLARIASEKNCGIDPAIRDSMDTMHRESRSVRKEAERPEYPSARR